MARTRFATETGLKKTAVILATLLVVGSQQLLAFSFSESVPKRSVVKIHVTMQRDDYALPWRADRPAMATGSGFIIEKKRILTNAHVVSDAKFIQVQKEGDPRRYMAKVALPGHDCDLALLQVEDSTFFDGTEPVKFAKTIPKLNDEVMVVGYPLGGDRVSITKGVVSRIDYSPYSHSGVDQHLTLQVDAAINPGNSGGPVLFKNQVVGLAFQGLTMADNIGYAIPVPVITHYLEDVEDGVYNGYPELGAYTMDTRNPALRRKLGLTSESVGVAVYYVDPYGSAMSLIKEGDVLLSADGYPIDSDGNIELESNSIPFFELMERKQWGQKVVFEILRAGNKLKVTVPLTNPTDPFAYRNLYDVRPRYIIAGGLVFCPVTREYMKLVERGSSGFAAHQLQYYFEYAKIDGHYKDRDEFVALIRRLPHEINTYADPFMNGIVSEVNGVKIRNLRELKAALAKPQDGYHILRFEGFKDFLVLDAKAAETANRRILKEYGVGAPENMGDGQ